MRCIHPNFLSEQDFIEECNFVSERYQLRVLYIVIHVLNGVTERQTLRVQCTQIKSVKLSMQTIL